jgi:hypothetical protein
MSVFKFELDAWYGNIKKAKKLNKKETREISQRYWKNLEGKFREEREEVFSSWRDLSPDCAEF